MEIRFIILNILPQDTQTLNHKKRDTFKPFRVLEPFLFSIWVLDGMQWRTCQQQVMKQAFWIEIAGADFHGEERR